MTQLNVFPVRLDSKAPAIKGWHDAAKPLQEWLEDYTWAQHTRWGAPAGPVNGWWVLDIDPRHGGLESLSALQSLYGILPPTRVVKTPSGGTHMYWKWVKGCELLTNTAGKLGPGLDIRAEGGMVLVPPTAGYEVMSNSEDLAEAPTWLLALLMPAVSARTSSPAGDGEEPIRNPRTWGAGAVASAVKEIREAPAGSRDHTMNRNAYGLGRVVVACGLDRDKVVDLLVTTAIEAGYDPHKALDCCSRAVDAGMNHPRAVAPPAGEPQVADPVRHNGQPDGDGNRAPEVPLRPCPPKPPGPRPADPTSQAGLRWDAMDNEYRAWQRDLRTVLDARLVVVGYDQTRVLYVRRGLRRVEVLGTQHRQAGVIIQVAREGGLLVSAGKASELAEEYLKADEDKVVRARPTIWDSGDGLYLYESPKVEAGETPTWDTLLERMSDPDAFLAHVWSAFEPRFRGRQVLWLQGEGNDGKSIAFDALFEGSGTPFAALSDSDLIGGNQFVFSSVWDKPAVLIGESKNVNVLMTGMVHKLTGRDPIPVEYKHGQRFAAKFQGVVFVTSNNLPQIERTRSNLTRLSVVTIDGGAWIDDLPGKLRREVPALLARAHAAYSRLCPTHFEIHLNAAARDALGRATSFEDEQNATAFALTGLRIEGDDFLARAEVFKRLLASGSKLADVNKVASFYRWLERQDGVKAVKQKGTNGFRGLKP